MSSSARTDLLFMELVESVPLSISLASIPLLVSTGVSKKILEIDRPATLSVPTLKESLANLLT